MSLQDKNQKVFMFSSNSIVAGYRPWLDGFRAILIAAVIIDHAFTLSPVWSFGSTGVGLFFVLSGYLITGLLMDEFQRTGTLDLKTFYIRRLARLLPAMILIALAFSPIFLMLRMHSALISSFTALFYVANYATVYAGKWLPAFGHTWSLAVEEHFYLLWPPILAFMMRKNSLKYVLNATLLTCIFIFLWKGILFYAGAPTLLSAVGTIERSDDLLFGCAASIAVRMGWRPKRWMLYLGAALIVTHFLMSPRLNYSRHLILGIGGALFIVSMEYIGPEILRKVLTWSPLVWLGTISYGLYLWHMPVFYVFEKFHMNGALNAGMMIALSIGFSWLSFKYFEMPIRDRIRDRTSQKTQVARRLERAT